MEVFKGGNEWFIVDKRFRVRAIERVVNFAKTFDWSREIRPDNIINNIDNNNDNNNVNHNDDNHQGDNKEENNNNI